MEIKGNHHINRRVCLLATMWFALVLCSPVTSAQPPLMNYTVKGGKMFITLGKLLDQSSLDSFIRQYDLGELALREFISRGFRDSLQKYGWTIEMNNEVGCVISKPLFAIENIGNPADRIIFTEKNDLLGERFPAVSNSVVYGFNRFKNKSPFTTNDSVVTFYLRGHGDARRVMLAGSFNNWDPDTLAMTKTDSGWIARVKLGPGKYWYKFVADGNWMIDSDNWRHENDGVGNVNSVFYKTNVVFNLEGHRDARRVYVSGSFNNWDGNELLMTKTPTGWTLPLYLADGTHRYRFVADRRWFADPANPDQFPNEFGEYNSVARVGKPYVFKLDGYLDAKQMLLSGSFNNWREDELFMNKTATGWELQYTIGPGNYSYRFIADGKKVYESQTPFVIEPNYTFRLKGLPEASKVFLAGDFNNWNTTSLPMKKQGDEWVCMVHLSMGKHLYKFIVDDNWIIDPGNKLWEQNEHNTGNSVLWFGWK